MCHAIVRSKSRGVFEQLSRGEWRESLADVAPDEAAAAPIVD